MKRKRSVKILEQALNKINPINKKQKDFFMILIKGLIGISGKRTFRNLARYMQMTEHTFARQMQRTFDFIGLNAALINQAKGNEGISIAAQDSSFVKKSGKSTNGLDYFWNSCSGKTEKGLEIDVISVIKIDKEKKESYAFSAQQTPADPTPKSERKKKKSEEPTKIDFYLDHVKKVSSQLLKLGIQYMAVDAFFAKIKYVSGVVSLGLHVVSKLRKDARLLRMYNGPQKPRGRKRKFDKGRVSSEDFKNSPIIVIEKEKIELQYCIAHSVSLDRTIKVVRVKKRTGTNRYAEAFLCSTDINLDAQLAYQFYVARFQIEFIFRDAKGFTGLIDCQSRDSRRLHYHFNASLTALNVAKLQDNEQQKNKRESNAFSITNWNRKYHVEIVINRFISMFGIDQTLIKLHPNYDRLLSFGNIRH